MRKSIKLNKISLEVQNRIRRVKRKMENKERWKKEEELMEKLTQEYLDKKGK